MRPFHVGVSPALLAARMQEFKHRQRAYKHAMKYFNHRQNQTSWATRVSSSGGAAGGVKDKAAIAEMSQAITHTARKRVCLAANATAVLTALVNSSFGERGSLL